MGGIKWTSQALNDLESITEYIAADSSQYASLFVIDIIEAVERLEGFPRAGRIVPEFNSPNIREIICGSYRVVYRVKFERVVILTVHHGARLINEKDWDSLGDHGEH